MPKNRWRLMRDPISAEFGKTMVFGVSLAHATKRTRIPESVKDYVSLKQFM